MKKKNATEQMQLFNMQIIYRRGRTKVRLSDKCRPNINVSKCQRLHCVSCPENSSVLIHPVCSLMPNVTGFVMIPFSEQSYQYTVVYCSVLVHVIDYFIASMKLLLCSDEIIFNKQHYDELFQ